MPTNRPTSTEDVMLRIVAMLYIRIRDALLRRWWRLTGQVLLRAHGIEGGRKINLYGAPILSLEPGSRMTLGDRITMCSHSRYTALGVSHPVVVRTLTAEAEISIGSDVGMSGTVICAAKSVRIGNSCLFGADVQITDTDFHPIEARNRRFEKSHSRIMSKPVQIGNNVFLGAGVKVLKGVSIGDNTVVGAGSIVTRNLPANVVATGAPARPVGVVN